MLKDEGYHVKVVTEFPDRSFSFLHYISEETLPFVAAAMQRARLVIGNDSGPAHLAGTLQTRTLAIHGPTTARIYNHIPEVTSFIKISLGCSGCHCLPSEDPSRLGWRASCDYGCGELFRTFPEEVFDVATAMLVQKEAAA
jgi:ADP-heptose:LPS heptosyltransferase